MNKEIARKSRLRLYVFLLLFIVLYSSIGADTVLLNNGRRIKGQIISQDESRCVVRVGGARVSLRGADIKEIHKSDDIEQLIQEGDNARRKGNFAVARRYYTEALLISPDSTQPLERLEILERERFFTDDLPSIDSLLASEDYYKAAGQSLALLRRYDAQEMKSILSQRAGSAYLKLARRSWNEQESENTLINLRNALSLNPAQPEAHVLLGRIMLASGRNVTAGEEFAVALAFNPHYEEACVALRNLGIEYNEEEIEALRRDLTSRKLDVSSLFETGPEDIPEPFTPRLPPSQPIPEMSSRMLSVLLQSYNAGPWTSVVYNGNVRYKETRDYVSRVLSWINRLNELPSTYDTIIRECASDYGFEFDLVKALIKVESNFNPRCVSRVDARGLMQIVKSDWKDTIRRLGVNWDFDTDVWDPQKNITVGCHYLRWLKRDFLPRYFKEFR